jgi:hypothetical protein
MTTFLYCFKTGEAYFGPKVPHGAIMITKQTDYEAQVEREIISNAPDPADVLTWRERMTARLRHGYEPGVLLVPGIPEATSDKEAMNALVKFTKWCRDV